jgi:type VI protein secretion system component Hcp
VVKQPCFVSHGRCTLKRGGPRDQISLGFGRIEVEYRPQKSDGSLGAIVKAGWDVQKNAKSRGLAS